MKRQNFSILESLFCSSSQASVHLFFCGIGGSRSLFRRFNGRHLNRNTHTSSCGRTNKKGRDLNWWMSHCMKNNKTHTKNAPTWQRNMTAADADVTAKRKNMISNQTEAFFIFFLLQTLGLLWRADWGALSARLAGTRAHSTCAVIVTGIVCRRWRRPASLYRRQSSNFQLQQASLVSSHYGHNNGPPHSRMFRDSISIGAGPVATLSNGMRPRDSAMERSDNGRLLRHFHLVLPFKLWIRDWSKFPLFM